MNKILVLFDSATGNVKQMADLVGEGAALVPETEVRVRDIALRDVYVPVLVHWGGCKLRQRDSGLRVHQVD